MQLDRETIYNLAQAYAMDIEDDGVRYALRKAIVFTIMFTSGSRGSDMATFMAEVARCVRDSKISQLLTEIAGFVAEG